jgi:hypothetical protein
MGSSAWWWVLLAVVLALLALLTHGLIWWRVVRKGLAFAQQLSDTAETVADVMASTEAREPRLNRSSAHRRVDYDHHR